VLVGKEGNNNMNDLILMMVSINHHLDIFKCFFERGAEEAEEGEMINTYKALIDRHDLDHTTK
jgi:hypothetical protein